MPPGSRPRFVSIAVLAGIAGCSLANLSGFTTPASNDGAIAADSGASDGATQAPASDAAPKDASATNAYTAAVLADKPVAYFRFDEDATARGLTDDIQGRFLSLTSHVKPGGDGISGRGLSLDGEGELDLGDVFDFDGLTPFALEAWVKSKPIRGVDQHLFHKRREGAGDMLGYIFYLGEDGAAHFEGWGVELTAWTEAPIPTTYTHLVATVAYDSSKRGNVFVWVNGLKAPKGGWDNTAPLANTDTPLRIGAGFVGELDEVAIYDHALSDARIVAHYSAGKP